MQIAMRVALLFPRRPARALRAIVDPQAELRRVCVGIRFEEMPMPASDLQDTPCPGAGARQEGRQVYSQLGAALGPRCLDGGPSRARLVACG